jgi:hypothetical protein
MSRLTSTSHQSASSKMLCCPFAVTPRVRHHHKAARQPKPSPCPRDRAVGVPSAGPAVTAGSASERPNTIGRAAEFSRRVVIVTPAPAHGLRSASFSHGCGYFLAVQ